MSERSGERHGDDGVQPALHSPWAAAPRERRPRSVAYRSLLDLDLDLAESLDRRMRPAARAAATALTFEAEAGDVALGDRLAACAPGPGVLVLDGVLALNVRVGDRIAAELLGPGDLVEPGATEGDDLLAVATEWRGLQATRYAMLDGDFAQRVLAWPQLTQALLRRGQRRARNLNIQRAIACQPRLEVRLALLLWHLAARWGRVEPSGIRLALPLTHQLLGRLIGAERPSVSHALGRLARAGMVTGHGDEWHLHGAQDQLAGILDPAGRVRSFTGTAAAPGRA
ncbi:MAG: Crp/Fnr family transcriptional regulator [Solirubrobacterales bacterium]|nr:Crp/Fnr family transcriptional regulator [Solirubrobacterales bacterium]